MDAGGICGASSGQGDWGEAGPAARRCGGPRWRRGPPRAWLWRDRGREHVRAVARVAAVGLHEDRLERGAVVRRPLVVAQEVAARDRRCGVVERRGRGLGRLPDRSAVMGGDDEVVGVEPGGRRGILGVMAYQVTAGRFVGRAQELARLRDVLARAATGEPLVALVGGEAGIGKTRLADQLAATANQQGVRVLRGGCVPLGEEGVPFAPVIEALRGLAGELDVAELEAVAGPARADLGRLLPGLGWDGAAPAAAVAGAGQGRLFELLLGVIERLAASAPLLLVMEDLHWADRSTRDLVAFLAASLRPGPVMLVLTFRSDELHRAHPLRGLLGELARNRRVQRLELPRFTRAELAEQLAALLAADPPARVAEEIYARSEGNPFFAEELLRAGEGRGLGALP